MADKHEIELKKMGKEEKIFMSIKNCINCGAPIDKDKNKCQYCGVSYFDISFLDLEAGEPFYLITKFKDMKITQLVKPTMNMSIEINSDNCEIRGGKHNSVLTQFCCGYNVMTHLQFQAVFDKDKKMLKIEKELKI